jgi:hypothetical protein
VTSTGDVAKTAAPDPVSSESSAFKLAEVGIVTNVSKPLARVIAAHEVVAAFNGW